MYNQSSFLPRQDPDTPIRQTDSDAAVARLSAVQKHYLDDPFVTHLVPRAHLQPNRPPLINIGTYVRTRGIEDLVERWLSLAKEQGEKCQIVSLGAGSDTRFWRLEVRSNFLPGGLLKELLST
jgi:[phosphatase 2A protein]-leucine-carboxy methyltransferase